MGRKGRVTIIDVASKANVSPSTVSRVLNNYKWVNEDVKQRVEQAVAELKFVPNYSAKTMINGKSQMVVIVVPVIDNPFFTSLINRLVVELKKRKYYAVIYTTDNASEEVEFLNSSLCMMTDGIFDATSVEDLDMLSKIKVPLILLDRNFPDNRKISCVMNNNYAALYEIVSYLYGHGHRKIGFLIGEEGVGIARDRIMGYQDALRDFGIGGCNGYFKQDCWKFEAGVRGAGEMLKLQEPPTAIIAGNNVLCKGVLEELQNRSMKPGVDISLIGFEESEDDARVFQKLGISAMRIDTPAIAVRAVDIMMDMIGKTNADPVLNSFDLTFMERQSVARIT